MKQWTEQHGSVKDLEISMKPHQVAACREKEQRFVQEVVDLRNHDALKNIYEPDAEKSSVRFTLFLELLITIILPTN